MYGFFDFLLFMLQRKLHVYILVKSLSVIQERVRRLAVSKSLA